MRHNVGDMVRSLVRELRSHMPRGQKTKTENRSNVVTNSIKTLKMAHIKKILKILYYNCIMLRLISKSCVCVWGGG